MSKPTVFISHSSKDESILRKLKEKINEKLGGTVDIFLSSDGQSIPLGKNWVHRVEKALGDAKLMIVILSPASINSNWIYFEAGFSYSKDIRVVPVGILGLDIGKISAPLSLLQGFNINNEDGLNNIIALINSAFDFSYKETFDEDDFNEIFRSSSWKASSVFGEYTSLINIIVINYHKILIENFSKITTVLDKNKIDYHFNGQVLYTHGVEIRLHTAGVLRARVDPTLPSTTFPIIDFAALEFIDDKSTIEIMLFFNSWVSHVTDSPRLTARFYGSEISLGDPKVFLYKDLSFSFETDINTSGKTMKVGNTYLRINCSPKKLSEIPLSQLVALLFEKDALYISQGTQSIG